MSVEVVHSSVEDKSFCPSCQSYQAQDSNIAIVSAQSVEKANPLRCCAQPLWSKSESTTALTDLSQQFLPTVYDSETALASAQKLNLSLGIDYTQRNYSKKRLQSLFKNQMLNSIECQRYESRLLTLASHKLRRYFSTSCLFQHISEHTFIFEALAMFYAQKYLHPTIDKDLKDLDFGNTLCYMPILDNLDCSQGYNFHEMVKHLPVLAFWQNCANHVQRAYALILRTKLIQKDWQELQSCLRCLFDDYPAEPDVLQLQISFFLQHSTCFTEELDRGIKEMTSKSWPQLDVERSQTKAIVDILLDSFRIVPKYQNFFSNTMASLPRKVQLLCLQILLLFIGEQIKEYIQQNIPVLYNHKNFSCDDNAIYRLHNTSMVELRHQKAFESRQKQLDLAIRAASYSAMGMLYVFSHKNNPLINYLCEDILLQHSLQNISEQLPKQNFIFSLCQLFYDVDTATSRRYFPSINSTLLVGETPEQSSSFWPDDDFVSQQEQERQRIQKALGNHGFICNNQALETSDFSLSDCLDYSEEPESKRLVMKKDLAELVHNKLEQQEDKSKLDINQLPTVDRLTTSRSYYPKYAEKTLEFFAAYDDGLFCQNVGGQLAELQQEQLLKEYCAQHRPGIPLQRKDWWESLMCRENNERSLMPDKKRALALAKPQTTINTIEQIMDNPLANTLLTSTLRCYFQLLSCFGLSQERSMKCPFPKGLYNEYGDLERPVFIHWVLDIAQSLHSFVSMQRPYYKPQINALTCTIEGHRVVLSVRFVLQESAQMLRQSWDHSYGSTKSTSEMNEANSRKRYGQKRETFFTTVSWTHGREIPFCNDETWASEEEELEKLAKNPWGGILYEYLFSSLASLENLFDPKDIKKLPADTKSKFMTPNELYKRRQTYYSGHIDFFLARGVYDAMQSLCENLSFPHPYSSHTMDEDQIKLFQRIEKTIKKKSDSLKYYQLNQRFCFPSFAIFLASLEALERTEALIVTCPECGAESIAFRSKLSLAKRLSVHCPCCGKLMTLI